MTPDAYEQMWVIYDEAQRCEPAQRQAFLDERCAGDADLRARLGQLLAQAEAGVTREFLKWPCLLDVTSRPFGTAEDLLVGRRIGPYEIQALIASGGMGSVYRAVRTRDYEQQVAVKLIKHGMDNHEILHRFLEERQVLAGLRHPNIARLLDGGTLDGRPYFIMEYIEGIPIDRFCEEQRLSTGERLELFRVVCAAVHFAHQNLVLHRDLKPSNILVDSAGAPKLVDFGIAKVLNPQWSQSAQLTRTEHPLTPEYASPEQLRGDAPPNTTSDVYALGVVLYELLTGHRPHEATGDQSIVGFARMVCEQEPVPPRRWRPKLPRDLEVICLKCLRKDPRRRYVSAEALAEELGRFLAGEPIQARPVGIWERAAKWAKRRPAAAALLGVSAVAALVLLAGGLWHQATLNRSNRELNATVERLDLALEEVQVNHERAEANVSFALGLIRKIWVDWEQELAKRPGTQLKLRQRLTEACDSYEKLLEMNRTQDPPMLEQIGLAYRQLASLQYVVLGQDEEGLKACKRAVDFQRQLVNAFPNEHRYRHELAGSLQFRANLLRYQGNDEDAEQDYTEALKLHEQLQKEWPNIPQYRDSVARHYRSLAAVMRDREWKKEPQIRDPDRLKEIETGFADALKLHRELAADYPHKPSYRQAVASDQHVLGLFLARMQTTRAPDSVRAEMLYREAEDLLTELVKGDPERKHNYQHDLGRLYHDLGSLLGNNGEPSEAQDILHKAIQLHKNLTDESPDVPDYAYELARHYRQLGNLLRQIVRKQRSREVYQQAREAYQESRELFTKLADSYQQRPTYRGELGITLVRLGELLSSGNELPAARRCLENAIEHLNFVIAPELKVKNRDPYHRALRDGSKALAELPAQKR
jgi:serine/threonine protein kinase